MPGSTCHPAKVATIRVVLWPMTKMVIIFGGESPLTGQEDHAADEEQVIPAEQHVLDAERHEAQDAEVSGLTADAVGKRRRRHEG